MSTPDRLFPEHHDTVFGESSLGPVQVRGASVRGLAHRHAGIVRQDDYCVRWTDDDRHLVIAVTDGVSAGRFSHEAAGVAARQSCEVVAGWLRSCAPEEILWDHVLKVVGDAVVTRGRGLLRRRGEDVESLSTLELAGWLSTTLIVAVMDLESDDEGRLAVTVLRVGDSTAWVRGVDGGWSSPFAVKNEGEQIASSATSALPHVTGFETAAVMLVDGEVLALMTDGVGDPLGDGHGEVGAFLAGAWAQPPSGLAFAAQVDFARKSFDDDRTVVAVWPGSPNERGTPGPSTSME
ncbi:protein phosphatase 2C domain-containing protein [Actinomycetospora sp. CA-084318]|uniref:protein phosphatase 2C domain-containing protein n=1 Tax=Actinomycetospora sp. CA-084318 TaxID=3239892 RepID=UPI003D965BA8